MRNIAKIMQTILAHDCLCQKAKKSKTAALPFLYEVNLIFWGAWRGGATFGSFAS